MTSSRISAGFDRHQQDWGGTLTTEDYFTIGRDVRDYALTKCDGRYYAVLEGGYNTSVLGETPWHCAVEWKVNEECWARNLGETS